jgi:hypothetical protein
MTEPPEISITKSLGLDTTFNDYSAFVAAAGVSTFEEVIVSG